MAGQGDAAYRAARRVPKRDTNNFQPRLGFNWNPKTESGGLLGIADGRRQVRRARRLRAHARLRVPEPGAQRRQLVPFRRRDQQLELRQRVHPAADLHVHGGRIPNLLTRTVVAEDFRARRPISSASSCSASSPATWCLRVGYVGTQGQRSLPDARRQPAPAVLGTATRVDPTRGVIRLRANAADSIYHSLQTGLEKRLSGGLSAGAHYTWSKFIDEASDTFNTSSGEVAVAQDSFDLDNDRAVSAYDRPHRLTANVVYELPFAQEQNGFLGRSLGGWTLSGVLTLQSGAPFTVLNGVDPTGALAGIDGLVGNSIRPNLNTDLELSKMTIEEILAAGGGSLFRALCGCRRHLCRRARRQRRPQHAARRWHRQSRRRVHQEHAGRRTPLQVRIEMFNATNTRNFGIPEGRINNANFLNQWGTNGGSRTIWGALRYIF